MNTMQRLLRRSAWSGGAVFASAVLLASVLGVRAEDASLVGAETCLGCHQGIEKHIKNDVHASVDLPKKEKGAGADALPANLCETCHGPGSKHVESGGKTLFIQRQAPENCLKCHAEIKAKLKLQHHHPILEGRVDCSDCHGFHGSGTRTNTAKTLAGPDDKCFQCHKEVKGPYVYEHDAMREGCQTCHDPHGSVQDKMLVGGQTTVCIRCHVTSLINPAGTLSAGIAHGSDPSVTGAGGGDYDIGRGEECIDHHRAPHGSNIWRTFNR